MKSLTAMVLSLNFGKKSLNWNSVTRFLFKNSNTAHFNQFLKQAPMLPSIFTSAVFYALGIYIDLKFKLWSKITRVSYLLLSFEPVQPTSKARFSRPLAISWLRALLPAICHLFWAILILDKLRQWAIFKLACSVKKHGKCTWLLFPFWHNPIVLWLWIKLCEIVCHTHWPSSHSPLPRSLPPIR